MHGSEKSKEGLDQARVHFESKSSAIEEKLIIKYLGDRQLFRKRYKSQLFLLKPSFTGVLYFSKRKIPPEYLILNHTPMEKQRTRKKEARRTLFRDANTLSTSSLISYHKGRSRLIS